MCLVEANVIATALFTCLDLTQTAITTGTTQSKKVSRERWDCCWSCEKFRCSVCMCEIKSLSHYVCSAAAALLHRDCACNSKHACAAHRTSVMERASERVRERAQDVRLELQTLMVLVLPRSEQRNDAASVQSDAFDLMRSHWNVGNFLEFNLATTRL